MRMLALIALIIAPLLTFADEPNCEEIAEGQTSFQNLLETIRHTGYQEEQYYRIHMRAPRLSAEQMREIPNLQSRISRYGDTLFRLYEITSKSSQLNFEFTLRGKGYSLAFAVAEMQRPDIQKNFGLKAHSWRASEPPPPNPELLSGAALEQVARRRVETLNITARTANALRAGRVYYVGDLLQLTDGELHQFPGLGRRAFYQIKEELLNLKVHLRMPIPGWPYEDLPEHQWIGR